MSTPRQPEDQDLPAPKPGDGMDLPTIELRETEQGILRVLRSIQTTLITHPVAGQAAFNALLQEGRNFAKTEEGRALKTKIERSELLHRARLIFDFSTLSMLEEDPPEIMPSAYIDVLFMLASSDRTDQILDKLFRGSETSD